MTNQVDLVLKPIQSGQILSTRVSSPLLVPANLQLLIERARRLAHEFSVAGELAVGLTFFLLVVRLTEYGRACGIRPDRSYGKQFGLFMATLGSGSRTGGKLDFSTLATTGRMSRSVVVSVDREAGGPLIIQSTRPTKSRFAGQRECPRRPGLKPSHDVTDRSRHASASNLFWARKNTTKSFLTNYAKL
jgi:hypothetical protein